MADEVTFEPLATERLIVRATQASDVDALVERRNQPEVARFQNWTLPYSRQRGEALVELAGAQGPTSDNWWMATVTDREGVIVGDLALKLEWDGRSAEVGYTFAPQHWGKGYAVEAVDALLSWLIEERGVLRVHAMIHPDNVASAQVLERCGFEFEGRTRKSYWVGDENTDDILYGVLADDWRAWRSRPKHRVDCVELVEITPANSRAVGRLRTHKSQEDFVAPMAASFGDALFPEVIDGAPVVPWYRAVRCDGELAGFVMTAEVTDAHPDPYLWRLLVDRRFQRRGVGSQVLDVLCERFRTDGCTSLLTSWVDGRGSPRPFYEGYGFEPTGEVIDGEIEGRLLL